MRKRRPGQGLSEGPKPCKSSVTVKQLAPALRELASWRAKARPGADHGRAPRRAYGADRGSEATRGPGRGDDLRQSDAVRGERGPRPLSAAGGGGRGDARGGGLRPALAAAVEDMYPAGFATNGQRRGLSASAGRARRGRAISTASRRSSPSCFCRVRPDVALFGEKDFQQLAVIRRMARTSASASRSSACRRCATPMASPCRPATPIFRPKSGSARWRFRTRSKAPRARFSLAQPVAEALSDARQSLQDAGFSRIDYFALVDAATLEPLESRRERCA